MADEVVPYSVEYYLGVVEESGINFDDESDDDSDDEKKPRKKSSTK